MLPVFISYFAGGKDKKGNAVLNSAVFVAGFTSVFCLLGIFAGTVGVFLRKYGTVVKIICGCIVIVFGLVYLGLIRFGGFSGKRFSGKVTGVISAFLFGIVYSVNLTPCVGAFLGSALMLASSSSGAARGFLLLLLYSLGLGIPFVISAVITDRLVTVFDFIKKHYSVINTVCGIFLILTGILMMTGLLDRLIPSV